MATFAFTDAFFSIGGTDLSNDVKSVTLDTSGAELDDTAMGDTYISRIGGLKDWNCTVEFNQDTASGQVDATLFPLLGTTATVIVRADNSDGVSATNPNYTGAVLLTAYTPVTGSVGDLATASATFTGAGALSRATA